MTTSEQTNRLLQFDQCGSHKQHSCNLDLALTQARTGWLKDWLQENLPEILDLQDTPDDHDLAKEWDKKAKQMMSDRGLTTPSQQKNRLTDLRNAIKAIDPNHPALADVGFTTEEWELINRPSEDKVSERTTKFLTDPDAIVNRASELLSSREWNEVAAGLAVLTGRRCSEILKTATFTDKSAYSVIFMGALKRRNEGPQLRFEIPTLAPAHKVIRAIAKLREWVDTTAMTNTDVNNRYAEGVIKACDRHFRDLVPPRQGEDNLYTHLFRSVYSTIATHWYCPTHVPELEYRAYIQGHFKILEEKDPTLRRTLASDRHYFDYQISDGNGNIDGRLGIKLGLLSVEVLEAFKGSQSTSTSVMTVNVDQTSSNEIPHSVPVLATEPEPESEDESLMAKLTQPIKDLLESDRYILLLTGLMAATGRSPGELLKSATFESTDEPNVLRFSPTGIGAKSALVTLVEADLIKGAIAWLREHPDVQSLLYLAPNEINTRCLPHVIRTMRQHLLFRELKQMQTAYSTLTHQSTAELISSSSKQPQTVIYHIYRDDKQRLSAIAQRFNCPNQAATASTALDWAVEALKLAQRLQLQSPQQLEQWFEEQSSTLSQPLPLPSPVPQETKEPELEPIPLPKTPETTERTERLEQMFITQQQSLSQLTAAIATLVFTLNQFPQPPSPSQTPTPSKPTYNPPRPSTESTDKIIDAVSQSFKPSSGVAASYAKVNAYIDAILRYNNEAATTKKDKWLVAISALKQLTKCNQDLIKRVIESRRDEIEVHHAQNELGKFQNSKGKLAPKITRAISF